MSTSTTCIGVCRPGGDGRCVGCGYGLAPSPILAATDLTSKPDARRILVVEDEVMVAKALEMLLTDSGYVVVGPVGTVGAALKAAADERLDGAVLNINLRDGDSRAISTALMARGVPFALITSHGAGDPTAVYEGIRVLSKPYRVTDLMAFVDNMFARAEPRHAFNG